MYEALAALGLFALLYSSLAGGIERTWLSGAIMFTLFGIVAGPLGFNWLPLETGHGTMKTLAELTLALVLFSDAAEVNFAALRHAARLPVRLLLVGLPLTLLSGFALGMLVFDQLGLFELALLATMLAPTDAALGKAVISNPAVPDKYRQALNVESGLNDGICVPILFLFLALAQGEAGDKPAGLLAITLVVEEVGIGLIVGILLSSVAVWLLHVSHKRGWISKIWVQLPVVALAIACFGAAQALGGSGFIACFIGGLVFGTQQKQYRQPLLHAAEGTGNAFTLITWVIFGAMLVEPALEHFSWPVLLYALLSLTLMRMLPVFIALTGLGLRTEAKLFAGWFGPRGLASIVFAVIVADAHLPGGQTLSHVVAWTVILSIIGHGISAIPWAKAFGMREKATETNLIKD